MNPNESVALGAIRAIEERDFDRLNKLYHPEVSFHWPPGLPYAGTHTGPAVAGMSEIFASIWLPLQPDEYTRRMDARVLASTGDLVVVRYSWRGRSPGGESFETDTVACYQIKNGQLFDARMYHYDLSGLIAFIHDHRS